MADGPDFGRIKRNISKMISLGAPETDIDNYVASEKVTPEMLRGAPAAEPDYVQPQPPPGEVIHGSGGDVMTLANGNTRAMSPAESAGVAAARDPSNRAGNVAGAVLRGVPYLALSQTAQRL